MHVKLLKEDLKKAQLLDEIIWNHKIRMSLLCIIISALLTQLQPNDTARRDACLFQTFLIPFLAGLLHFLKRHTSELFSSHVCCYNETIKQDV